MKVALIFSALAPAFIAATLTSGCGSASNLTVPVTKSGNQNKNGTSNGSQNKETTGAMGGTERQFTPILAIMRVEHTVALLFDPPAAKSEVRGCANYASMSGNGMFIFAHYEDCLWKTTSNNSKIKQDYSLSGTEEFDRSTDKPSGCTISGDSYEKASSAIAISLPRAGKATTSKKVTDFNQTVCSANHSNKTKTTESSTSWGNSTNPQIANWSGTLKSAIWSQDGSGNVNLEADAQLDWLYTPASGTKSSAPSFKSIFKPVTRITFAKKCPWPISGTAQLMEIDQKGVALPTVTFTFSATGYTTNDGGSGTATVAWPTDHCAGTF